MIIVFYNKSTIHPDLTLSFIHHYYPLNKCRSSNNDAKLCFERETEGLNHKTYWPLERNRGKIRPKGRFCPQFLPFIDMGPGSEVMV